MWRLEKHRTLVTYVTKHVTLLGSHVEQKRCLAPSGGRSFTDRWRPSAVKWHRMKKCCECYLLLSARAWPPDIRGAEFCPCHTWGRYPEERLNTVKINALKAAYTQTFCYNLIKRRQQRASMVYSAFSQTYTFPFSNPTLEGVGHILCHITWCCWLDLSTFLCRLNHFMFLWQFSESKICPVLSGATNLGFRLHHSASWCHHNRIRAGKVLQMLFYFIFSIGFFQISWFPDWVCLL